MNWINWVILVLGVWLVFSPWVFGISDLGLWNNVVGGVIIILASLWLIFGEKKLSEGEREGEGQTQKPMVDENQK